MRKNSATIKFIRIGVLAEGFINWGGGIDFLASILNGLASIKEDSTREYEIIIFLPLVEPRSLLLKNLIKNFANQLGANFKINSQIPLEHTIKTFGEINEYAKIVKYSAGVKNLKAKIVENKIDIILPAMNALSRDLQIPWIGYLYDFQHKYIPEYFTQSEINRRDGQFSKIITEANLVMVNSNAVKSDILRFYGAILSDKVHVLPFTPKFNKNAFNDQFNLAKYQLPKNYFIISNQFWRHKDHITAFQAFKIFTEKSKLNNVHLICTGKTEDSRFPNYFNSLIELLNDLQLNDRVKILGYIPKLDQLHILKNSIALIQPTLFEGGPGGGSVFDSVGYGVPSIVSDIAINLEIEDDSVTFFKHKSPADLAEKMLMALENPKINKSINELEFQNLQGLKRLGKEIQTMINKVI